MLIEIKHRFAPVVLFSHDCENNTIGLTVEAAFKVGANLDGAYLEGATYGIATLAKGVLQIIGLYWPVMIFDAHIKIGCKLHLTQEWTDFNYAEIAAMESHATEFWKKNRDMILLAARTHQGE